MKIVILDAYTINPGDLTWDVLNKFSHGDIEIYNRTDDEEVIPRSKDADIVFTSKGFFTAQTFDACPKLKFIAVMATGYDNIDILEARKRGIAVCNVPAYSTDAVAQHTLALILEISNCVGLHNDAVQSGEWFPAKDFCFWKSPVELLKGKSLGIIGYGAIGKRVGELARVFGMEVYPYSKEPQKSLASDFISLHCPCTNENRGFVDKDFISKLKDGVNIINTARGALINSVDLAEALKNGKVAHAALDVLDTEPPKLGHPLIGIPNCIITPHIAWFPKEMREIVINTCADNLHSFLSGGTLNRVDTLK